jgi:hypothetical protein
MSCFQGFGTRCGRVLGSGLTRSEQFEILDLHNRLRAKLAGGHERRGNPGPQPSAADMMQMVSATIVVVLGLSWWLGSMLPDGLDQCLF